MRTILLLFMLACVAPAMGQTKIKWAFEKWGWGNTLGQVRDEVLGSPGWNQDSPLDMGDEFVLVTFTSSDQACILSFLFYKNRLIERGVTFQQGSEGAAKWDLDLFIMPKDGSEWIDKPGCARIKRIYNGSREEGSVTYKLVADFPPPAQAKQ